MSLDPVPRRDSSPASAAPPQVTSSRSTREALQAVLAEVAARPADLAAILAAAPQALLAFDAHRHILGANVRAERFFGWGPGELEGCLTDVLVPERLRQPDAPAQLATPDLVQVELPGLLRDGSELATEWIYGSVAAPAGPWFVLAVRDRDEAERGFEALRASEERFRLLVDGVRDYALFLLDAEGRVSSWNVGAARMKGWSVDEVLGQPYEIFFTAEDRAKGLPAQILHRARTDGRCEVVGWRVRKDGSRFRAGALLTALHDGAGALRGYAKVTRDRTELDRAEESERRLIAERAAREAAQGAEQRVRESEERLRRLQAVTASLSEALTHEDVANVVLRETLSTFGADGGAVYALSADGSTLELLGERGHPNALAGFRSIRLDLPAPVCEVARTRTALFFGSAESCAERFPLVGSTITSSGFEGFATLPLVSHGALLGVFAMRFHEARTFSDADRALLRTLGEICAQALERARLFAAERQARAEAEAASRSKDEFLAMLGHELRNPLAPISTAVQLMKLRGGGRSGPECEVIERQVGHLSKLVDDLLDVSRIARGLIGLSRTPVEAAEVLSRAVEMASPLLEQRAQHLHVTAPVRGLRMNADPLRLAQVVSNLLTNAAKYTPERGHVWLSAALEGDKEPGLVAIRVRDDGDGISADLLPRVFDLFVQGTRTIARSEGGLGLGLALVKNLVSLHGGTTTASSDGPGRGSEFVVRLPALAAEYTGEAPEPPESPPAHKTGKSILLVDDNEDSVVLLAESLRFLGHEVEVALDGPSALARLRTFPAQVAVLDLGLPVMDGFELARRIGEEWGGKRPRLIALTGYGQERDRERSRAAGFDVHLVKPVELATVAEALDRDPKQARH